MIVWLVSYPKSGNTWARAFLAAYLRPEQALDINNLRLGRNAGSRDFLDKLLGVNTAALPVPRVEALRPEAYRVVSRRADARGRPAFVKVHDCWKMTPWKEPLFPPAISQLAVYIARDPRDCAVSFAHHLGIEPAKMTENICNELFTLCVHGSSSKDQVPQLLRSWKSHVESWLETSPVPKHLMKYEEMLQDPQKAFRGLLAALNVPIDDARLAAAVKRASLPALQAQELLHGFNEKSKNADTPFFRSGKAGSHAKELTPDQAAKIAAYCEVPMRRLGYVK
jgi:aryl sulfotransferase